MVTNPKHTMKNGHILRTYNYKWPHTLNIQFKKWSQILNIQLQMATNPKHAIKIEPPTLNILLEMGHLP